MNFKKILSSVLAITMVSSLTAFNVSANETTAPDYPAVIESSDSLITGSDFTTVYYGGIPWRVLTKEYSDGQATPTNGILLMSEHAMANGIQYNAHYSNGRWSSKNKNWASAMVMPWDDERNPMYENNMATGSKTDDSSGGYLTSDIRMYLTGIGTYETFRPYAYYNESWAANSWGTPDRNSQANKYYIRNVVTETEPVEGVTYFVKGEFELSDHDRTGDEDGIVPITAADFMENTWYTLDASGNPVLLEEFPQGVSTVNAYFDQAGYSIADVTNGFEDGVTYYTFERKTTDGNVLPTVTTNGTEYAMGEHLAGLYLFIGYSIPELSESDSSNAITNGTFVAGLDASEKNFAKDMGFSELEKAAVLPTSGHGYNRGAGVNVGPGTTYADRLENDTYFSLSGEEVKLYLTDAGHTKAATYFNGNGVGDIWTRSWGKADTQCVIVYTNNACSWRQGANNTWQSIRPAFNLNPDAVLFYAPVDDADFGALNGNSSNEYKLTLKDADRDFEITPVSVNDGVYTVSYTGAATGENEFVSAIVKDADANIVAYGKVAAVQSENGEVEIDLSDVDMTNKKLYLLNEQCNGYGETNYASELKYVGTAKVGDVCYDTLTEAVEAADDANSVITLAGNISDETVVIDKDITLTTATGISLFAAGSEDVVLTNVIFDVANGVNFSIDGLKVTGLSYIFARTPESISVTNCDIDVTVTEDPSSNCPPAFVRFSSSQSGSVDLVFANNALLCEPDATEDWYTCAHGIAGWNYISSAVITGNIFGSEAAPMSAAAVKLMNFVDNATVVVENNEFYVNSTDSEYGPNALQLYQCNSRSNKYTAQINNNAFYVDENTAAVGINSLGEGNAYVSVGKNNTVNGKAISSGDVLVFGNGISNTPEQNGYVGIGVTTDANGELTSGTFSPETFAAVESMIADGYVATLNPVSGWYEVSGENLVANEISVVFEEVSSGSEDEKLYNINLVATSDIHEFASAEFTFENNSMSYAGAEIPYYITAADNMTLTTTDTEGYYGFSMNGTDDYEISGTEITIGQVRFTGYGEIDFAVTSGIVNATTVLNNLVKTFTVNGATGSDVTVGNLIINTGVIDSDIEVPTRELEINVIFPNAVIDNDAVYQDMTVTIVGGTVNNTYNLGDATQGDAAYTITEALPYNTTYVVTVSGAGYRTARYSVKLTTDKELTFWNNVMTEEKEIEKDNTNSLTTKNFLAGDIVKDNQINIYDLSAVVSYFGTTGLSATENPAFAKYDLNRDGKIDSKDVAYVLVSWNN